MGRGYVFAFVFACFSWLYLLGCSHLSAGIYFAVGGKSEKKEAPKH